MSLDAPDTVPETAAPADGATDPRPAEVLRQRRGKVARLRKVLRDKLNVMLLDGFPYAEILTALGEPAKDVTEQNITNWVTGGGYKAWLAEQRNLEETRVKQEVAMDLACPEGGSRIHQATLQLAATNLSQMVRNLDCTDIKELIHEDPKQLTPLLNALARISDAQLRCERHQLDVEPTTSLDNEPAKEPGLSTEARQEMERQLRLK
jgi:hypothetical protein